MSPLTPFPARLRAICLPSLSLLVLLAALGPVCAATLQVPGGYKTIAAALAAAKNGDVIMVADGTYDEYILRTAGKAVTLESQNGPTHCILDGQGVDSVFYVTDGEGPGTVIQGFTIQHGLSGIIIENNSNPTVQGCVFSNNDFPYNTVGFGGALHIENSSPTITHCAFMDNYASNGGAVSVFNNSSPVITSCTFTGNRANFGGAIEIYQTCSPTLTNCVFSNNSTLGVHNLNYPGSDSSGGAIVIEDGSLVLTRCAFTGNSAQGGPGSNATDGGKGSYGGHGGGYFGGPAYGGALVLGASSSRIQECSFTNNRVQGGAGGAAFSGSGGVGGYGGDAEGGAIAGGSPTIINCIFRGNSAQGGAGGSPSARGGAGNGGGISLGSESTGTLTLTNDTFTANAAVGGSSAQGGWKSVSEGGALSVAGGNAALLNSILYGDIADSGPEILQSGGGVTTAFCDVQGLKSGHPQPQGDINADPLFFAAPADLRLLNDSPCAGAGTTDGAPITDLDGRTRPNPPSIGAYEGPAGTLAG